MTAWKVLGIFNYGLVLVYGLFLSVGIAGGCQTRRQKRIVAAVGPVFLLVQSVCWLLFGVAVARQIYPLIVHLPLTLMLILVLKKPVGEAIVCTCTAYLCCQLPRWVNIFLAGVSGSTLLGEIGYTIVIVPIYLLLRRYFVGAAHDAMTCSPSALVLFGSLPVAYYLFDYATTIYSDILYTGAYALAEFLPTALIVFYVAFLTAYHVQTQNRTQAEMQRSMLESELRQSQLEIDALHRTESQTAVYQHDMRHHMNMIEGLLNAGESRQAAEYVARVQSDIAAITPRRFCENELVNLLCSAFLDKAQRSGVELTVDARLPRELPVSDTELCSILSNGLENAVRAAAASGVAEPWAELYCGVKLNKLLIEIKNPYAGTVTLRDGVPVSGREGHGFGCRSISAIARSHGGLCVFQGSDGLFCMQVILPVKGEGARPRREA